MDWKLIGLTQETNYPFLNFFVVHYEVGEPKKEMSYFLASRNDKKDLRVGTKDFSHADGVLIMAIREGDDPSVLLIEQFRPALGIRVVEFPAGLMEPTDSDMEETALREAKEESGVILRDVSVFCPPSPTSTGLSDELVGIVMGYVDEQGETELEQFEDISSSFVPLREIPTLLSDPSKVIAVNVRLCLHYLLEKYKVA